jgi:hypothetical protein
MKDICAADQTELDKLIYEFPDEALEIAAVTGGEKVGNITLYYYYCTALFFCPSPLGGRPNLLGMSAFGRLLFA